jgi:kynureninase
MERRMREEWGGMLIGGWNKAGWMEQPRRLGDRIGRLIGAEAGHSVNGRHAVDQGVPGAGRLPRPAAGPAGDPVGQRHLPLGPLHGRGADPVAGGHHELRLAEPEAVEEAITEEVAVLLLDRGDYRTGRRLDMAR